MARPTRTQPAIVPAAIDAEIDRIAGLTIDRLRAEWRHTHGSDAPTGFTKDLIARALTYRLQEGFFGGLTPQVARTLRELGQGSGEPRRHVKAGSIIVREFQGVLHEVLVVPGGFCWQDKTFDSLSTIAKRITGTSWNGPRFFGLRSKGREKETAKSTASLTSSRLGRRSSIATGPQR